MTSDHPDHTRADDDPRTQLGHQIGRRWHRAGPGRHAGLGVLASSSRRFVAGMGRGVLIRRAYAGPATAPVAGTRGLSVGPPRWWREAHLLAGAEPPDNSPDMPADTSPGRGLARALRPMPSAAPGRPQGTLMTSAPKTVPMRLPTEVTAVGRLTTPADTAARRIRPGREPGPSQGADSRSSAPAPAGGRAPESPPRPATSASSAPAIRRQAVATQTPDGPQPAATRVPSAAVGHGRPVPTEGLSRLAPRLARRRAAAAAAATPAPRTRIRRTTGGLPTAARASTSARLGSAVPPSRPSLTGRAPVERTQVARLQSTASPAGQSPDAQPQSTASRAGRAPAGTTQATRPPTASSPAGQTPAGQAPADQTPAGRAQAGPASVAQPQSAPSLTGQAPDGPASAGQTGSEAAGLAAAESGAASAGQQTAPAPLRTALRRMPSSTARLVRADPLHTGATDTGLTPGRHRADTVVPTTPRLGTHRVRPGGGWAVAARHRTDDGLAATAAGPVSPARAGRSPITTTSITHDEPFGSPATRPAQPVARSVQAAPVQASPALARRWETARAAHLPGATGRHWRAEPAAASRRPGLGIESPDLLAAAPSAGDPLRRVAAPDLSRARPRPAGHRTLDRTAGSAASAAVPARRTGASAGRATGHGTGGPAGGPSGGGAATHSAHGFPWLVAAAHTEIAPPSPGLPRVPAMSPVGAHPSSPFRAGPLGTAARPAPPVPRSARRSPDTSTGDVPGRFAGTSADVLAAPHVHRLTAPAGTALSALAGAAARVAPPRTVIQRVPAAATPGTPASAIPRPPAPSTGPSGGTAPGDDRPGVSFPIVRRWMAAAPSTPGAAMRADDRPLIGSQRTEETGLTDSVMARVDERIQARLAAELDSELSDRVHRIIDERLGAELERQAWRREAGGF